MSSSQSRLQFLVLDPAVRLQRRAAELEAQVRVQVADLHKTLMQKPYWDGRYSHIPFSCPVTPGGGAIDLLLDIEWVPDCEGDVAHIFVLGEAHDWLTSRLTSRIVADPQWLVAAFEYLLADINYTAK
jgi:hypothetical protein